MLKTSAIAAVVLMLGLPVCTLATTTENLDGKKPCEGNSVKEFLQGTCDKLKGCDSTRDIKMQSKDHKWNVQPFYEFSPSRRIERGRSFIPEAGGYGFRIYGEEGTHSIPPFFPFNFQPRTPHADRQYTKQSVDDFLDGKSNRLRGFDAPPDAMIKGKPLPPAWGGDEFVKTEGFTQSGQPYQNVNPLYKIPRFEFENLSKPEK